MWLCFCCSRKITCHNDIMFKKLYWIEVLVVVGGFFLFGWVCFVVIVLFVFCLHLDHCMAMMWTITPYFITFGSQGFPRETLWLLLHLLLFVKNCLSAFPINHSVHTNYRTNGLYSQLHRVAFRWSVIMLLSCITNANGDTEHFVFYSIHAIEVIDRIN